MLRHRAIHTREDTEAFMKFHHVTFVSFIAIGITAVSLSASAQPAQLNSGPQTVNPNSGSLGISPPVSGIFGVTPAPGAVPTPGYAPGAAPSSGVAGGAGPGMSSGAPFSGTGYGTNSIGSTPPPPGTSVPSSPAIGAQGGAMRPGGTSTNPALGLGPGPGSPGPSMGTTPSSGALSPGAGAGAGAGR